jgi:hypothetical protein
LTGYFEKNFATKVFGFFVLSAVFGIILLEPVYGQGASVGAQNISNNTGISNAARIAVHGNNVYIVWSDSSTGNGEIYFKRSIDNGTTFGSVENLANDLENSTQPRIVVSGNNVYVAWISLNATIGNGDIYFKRSIDNGTTFGTIRNLSRNNTGESISPQLAASGNNVYAVWSDTTTGNGDIYFRRSNNTGENFAGIRNLSRDLNSTSNFPQIAATADKVYVVWQESSSRNSEILLKASENGGDRFTGFKDISKNSTGDSISPQLAAAGDGVYVVWSDDYREGNFEILLRKSQNNGVSFGGNRTVGRTDGSSFDPRITVVGENLYVIWEEKYKNSINFDLFFRAGRNSGGNYTVKENLGQYIGELTDHSTIAAYGNNVYVAWSDQKEYEYPPAYDIFLRASLDSGGTFTDPINLSVNSGNSVSPQLAASGNNLYIVWSDTTTGNGDIYFRRLA